jgi:hypothetical protein
VSAQQPCENIHRHPQRHDCTKSIPAYGITCFCKAR